eukprot:scaffold215078_cov31-Tisochrysis_lutea.AAC.4
MPGKASGLGPRTAATTVAAHALASGMEGVSPQYRGRVGELELGPFATRSTARTSIKRPKGENLKSKSRENLVPRSLLEKQHSRAMHKPHPHLSC